MIGPEMRNKIKRWLCMALCIIMMIAIAPNVGGSLISSCIIACL